jgi:hypothetical protein
LKSHSLMADGRWFKWYSHTVGNGDATGYYSKYMRQSVICPRPHRTHYSIVRPANKIENWHHWLKIETLNKLKPNKHKINISQLL